MLLTRWSVDKPIGILMAFFAILLLGVFGYLHMPTELDPQISIPVVNIMTIYPGATPKQVEERVTRPLEEAVASISRVDGVDSTSLEHVSNVAVRFQEGMDPDVAAAEVKARVESSRGDLPPEAATPVVSKVDLNAQPVMVLGVSFKQATAGLSQAETLQKLRQETEDRVKPKISQVPGVASVKVLGGVEREIEVKVDPARLQQAGIALNDLPQQLRANSQNVSAGQLTEEGLQAGVRVKGELASLEQIRNIPLYPGSGGGGAAAPGRSGVAASPALLSDVATVEDVMRQPEQTVRVGGQPGVIVQVMRSSNSNTIEVAGRIKEETIPGLNRTTQLLVRPLQDYSEGAQLALEDITGSLILGSLLAILVVFVFLNSLKDTLIVAVAIPTSIIATFGVMWFAHFTLNQMTMLALSLSVGILVDDSILVLDSIHRHRRMGRPPRQASLDGRQEIGLADATNTLVDVVVFVPVAMMGGVIGMYFKQFGLTVATATLFSMYVSFTLTPMLTARWFRPGDHFEKPHRGFARWFNTQYARLEDFYRRCLAWALAHRPHVIIAGFGSLALALALAATHIGMEFVPSVDQGEVRLVLEMKPGTPLLRTSEMMRRLEQLMQRPDLQADIDTERMYASIGEITATADRLPERGPNVAELRLRLREKEGVLDWLLRPFSRQRLRLRSDQEITQSIRQALANISLTGVQRVAVSAFRSVTSRSRAAVTLTLLGLEGDEGRLGAAANSIVYLFGGVQRPEGGRLLDNEDTTYRSGLPELSVDVDRGRAAELRVPPAEIGLTIRTALEGNTDVRLREGDHTYPIRVQIDPNQVSSREALEHVVVANRGDGVVYLGDVASIRPASSQTRILRRDRRPMVRVTAELAPGVDLGTAKDRAERVLSYLQNVMPVAWSPNGRSIAAGSWDGTIYVWDIPRTESRRLQGHSSGIWCLAWSPDGRTLASGSFDGTIRLWDPATGQTTHVLRGHSAEVHSVAWSPDGKTLASGSADRRIRLWDASTGESLRELKGHGSTVSTVAWSPDGKTLASGSFDGILNLWDPGISDRPREIRAHTGEIHAVAWSPDGKVLASGGSDRLVRLWDSRSGALVRELRGHSSDVTSVAWNRDGQALASGSTDRTSRVWDPGDGRTRQTLQVNKDGRTAPIWSVAWSPDGQTLALGSGSLTTDDQGDLLNIVRLVDPQTGQRRSDFPVRPPRAEWGGDYSGMIDALRSAIWALVFAVALSYMLMAALFNSLLHPLTIMLSLPMALVGAILALLITGTPVSVVVMVGSLMLVGLVSKNAILLVDYTNTLRHRDSYDRDAAILEAGPVRLRPILMTTIAMILGMVPVAFRIGRAAEMRAPMAVVVIGGLLLSTLLTLIVIPVVYTYFDDATRGIQRMWARAFPVRLQPGRDGASGDGQQPPTGGEARPRTRLERL
jgi:HAE1 family hydrophobic/amphiphilic exporter-1